MEEIPFKNEVPFDIVDLTSRALSELISGREISSPGYEGIKSLEMVIALHLSDVQGNSRVTFPLEGSSLDKEIHIA
jgi:hypothetical protein